MASLKNNMRKTMLGLVLAAGLALSLPASPPVQAQAYPSGPIKIIVIYQ